MYLVSYKIINGEFEYMDHELHKDPKSEVEMIAEFYGFDVNHLEPAKKEGWYVIHDFQQASVHNIQRISKPEASMLIRLGIAY